jgi:hypothetical protein
VPFAEDEHPVGDLCPGGEHMISDHHGQATSIATSLLTAADAILGTHTPLTNVG